MTSLSTLSPHPGYALTEDGSKNCLKRKGNEATMIRCEKGYSQISLQCKCFSFHSLCYACFMS
jgi:hypothetical protein